MHIKLIQGKKMKKIIYLIFLSLFLVSCDFTNSKNPEASWIKSVKEKTFADDEGISFIFDANGNCSIKITEDTSNDFWKELGKLVAEGIFQFTYISAIDKNRAVYSMKILFMTSYFGLKLDKNKLFSTDEADTTEDVNWETIGEEYLTKK